VCDAACSQFGVMTARVIRAVGEQHLGSELAVRADRCDAIDELEQLGDVVAVSGRHGQRERDPVAAADDVMLAAQTGAIDRRRAGQLAPPLALTCELSAAALDQSISPASCSSSSST